jgi:uncharacterized protein (DUF2147 family)
MITPLLAAVFAILAAQEPPAAVASAPAASPHPAGSHHSVYGVWRSPSRGAHIKITPCEGDAICGKLLSASRPESNPDLLDIHNKDPAKRQSSMIGQTVFEGFKGGPHKWTGGRFYNPGDGKYYAGTISLVDHNHLKLKGCALRVLCKSQTWTRAEQPS